MWELKNLKKFKKYHDINYKVNDHNQNLKINFCYGLRVLKACSLSLDIFILISKIIRRKMGKNIKIKWYCFPDLFYYNKPQEVRMGKGKGMPTKRMSLLKSNKIFFIVEKYDEKEKVILLQTLKEIQSKIPVKTQIVYDLKW